MGRYSREPDNASKSCKARGPNLRVHFKVSCKLIPGQTDADLLLLLLLTLTSKSVVMLGVYVCVCLQH